MTDEMMTIREMCDAFEVTPRTLRYYEYIELLSPEKEGRSRFYTPRETARMTLILRGRRFGFSLEEIRQWLLLYEEKGTDEQNRAWIVMADEKLEDLIKQRQDLDEAIEDLTSLRDQVASGLDT